MPLRRGAITRTLAGQSTPNLFLVYDQETFAVPYLCRMFYPMESHLRVTTQIVLGHPTSDFVSRGVQHRQVTTAVLKRT